MTDQATCPRCTAPLPSADAPCPACQLQAGLRRPAAGGLAGFEPLSPEQLGARLVGYEVQTLIGAGGMGAVYRARHTKLDRLVAIKVLRPDLEADPAFAERFTREAQLLAKLDHPGVVRIFDFGEVGGLFYLVMEFVDGASLRELLLSGRLSPQEVLGFARQLCDALQAAHDLGIVHRDIKPENVLVDQEGRARIADFGLAKLVGAEDLPVGLTSTRQVLGTPHYMAPEQLRAGGAVDHRADLYSLGVLLYEMLTGDLPVGRFAPPSAKGDPGIRPLDPVVLRALENEPERRYQSASEVKHGLEEPTQKVKPKARRRQSQSAAGSAGSTPSTTSVVASWLRVGSILCLLTIPWITLTVEVGMDSLPGILQGSVPGQMELVAEGYRLHLMAIPMWLVGVASVGSALVRTLLSSVRHGAWLLALDGGALLLVLGFLGQVSADADVSMSAPGYLTFLVLLFTFWDAARTFGREQKALLRTDSN